MKHNTRADLTHTAPEAFTCDKPYCNFLRIAGTHRHASVKGCMPSEIAQALADCVRHAKKFGSEKVATFSSHLTHLSVAAKFPDNPHECSHVLTDTWRTN
jgi:hypothetical protein